MPKKKRSRLVACDTETTGIDPWHGTKPFLVTIATGQDDEVQYWEWEVNPETREPKVLEKDVNELQKIIDDCTNDIFHNPKFDVRMLSNIGITVPWEKVYDTLLATHILNSAVPHDLTYSALLYLGLDLKPLDEAIKDATIAARREAKKLGWRIAHKDLPEMPSAREVVWKNDLWVTRQIAEHQNLPKDHAWHHVVHDYALSDPVVTFALFDKLEKLIKDKGLWDLYLQRLKLLPIIYQMEDTGVTYSVERLNNLVSTYKEESEKAGRVCTNIAKGFDYELELPKSGNNKSLIEFAFNVLKLPPVSVSKKTGNPSLDKNALSTYQSTLSPRSKQARFIENLAAKRKRDTALNYMMSYERFSMVKEDGWKILHPSINLTGTKTLRNSSKNPNEQNISKQEGFNLRHAFGPAPGREWWSLDYNNLELRIPAYECQEPAMLELFENPSDPPYYGSYHLLIFSLLYPDLFGKHGHKVKDIYKSTLYQYTKNGNFAELYGAVDTGDGNSTADRAFHYPGAQAIVAEKLSKKAELNQYWINFANSYGYVTTMPDKTVDPDHGYPIHCPKTFGRGISPTIPLNYHVQGTACWVKLQAMIKCQEYLDTLNKKGKGQYYIVMEIHDEMVFDFPAKPNKGNLPKINRIKRLMESCGDDINIPLTTGIDYHPNNWGEAL